MVEAIKIRAEGAKLYKETSDERIADYKTMPLDELRAHIEAIKKGGGVAARPKGKAQEDTNGAETPVRQKGKTSPVTADKPKGKSSASTSAPAKSTAQKSSAKPKAAQGAAKRPTTAAAKGKGKSTSAKTQSVAKGRTSSAKTASTRKTATARKATSTKAQSTPRRKTAAVQGAARIDNKAIDWKAEWAGGQTGKRSEVMAALRKYKGDKAKVYELLAPKARTYYKGRTKDEAERLLVWLIGRVAFDFVTRTGQHEQGTRDGFGQSKNPINVRRRELRAERAAEAAREERRQKRQASQASKGKPAKKTASRTKGRS